MGGIRFKNRFTEGLNAQTFIAKDVAYTGDATFEAFQTNAVDGEVGFFTMPANGLQASATTLTLLGGEATVGSTIFFAQKQGELVKKTNPFVYTTEVKRKIKTAFALPTKHVGYIGYNGTDGDIDLGVIAKGKRYEFAIFDISLPNTSYPVWQYDYIATATDTKATITQKLVEAVNSANSLFRKEKEPIVTATQLSGGGGEEGIELTSIDFQVNFRLAVRDELADSQLRYDGFTRGSGYKEHIANLEYEGQIFDGTTTVNAERKANWGEQTKYSVDTLAYDVFQIDLLKRSVDKGTPNKEDTENSTFIIAAPILTGAQAPYVNAAASPIDEIVAVLGL